jgi:DmsE family decaheme c-type cytochrome
MTRFKHLMAVAVTLVAALLTMPAQAADQPPATYSPEGFMTCIECHKEPEVIGILQGPHAVKGDVRTPFTQHECESCHGPSEQHVKGRGRNRPPSSISFSGPHISSVEARNGVCLSCHQSGLRLHWQGSPHESSDVACSDCHRSHAAKDPVLVKLSQPEMCFTCHTEQRAQTLQYSHHPIREGKVSCSDCHNPHGSVGPKLVRETTINQTCYLCHAETRGPFLWEHEPVREDCTSCHASHGSVTASLLTDRMPYLCENCHGGNGGHNGAPFAGQNLPGANTQRAANGILLVPQLQINARSCLNCHSAVHGSNSPSGVYFTR